MKNIIRIIPTAVALLMVFCLSSDVHAAGMKIGAMGWYAWWDSQFIERHIRGRSDFRNVKSSYSMGPAPLYGPVLSFDFAKWSVNLIYTCGSHYRAEGGSYKINSIASFGKEKQTSDIFKYDIDPTLTYAVNQYFKVFAGMKVQGYSMRGKFKALSTSTYDWSEKSKTIVNSYGPGIGFGVTAPLAENLYLVTNLSGLYLRTRYVHNSGKYSAFHTAVPTGNYPMSLSTRRINGDLNVFGGNAGMSLAYVFAGPSITLSLGGRYQFLKYYMVGESIRERDIAFTTEFSNLINNLATASAYINGFHRILHNSLEHFYGITFSVIYSIDFSSAKKEEG